mmetsp:Transcript_20876/g.29008  ORF Transcript_20876/g.29008 Transcript_20876/m.29008 type:complete len:229 (-) Transcript_20876:44-730(-)
MIRTPLVLIAMSTVLLAVLPIRPAVGFQLVGKRLPMSKHFTFSGYLQPASMQCRWLAMSVDETTTESCHDHSTSSASPKHYLDLELSKSLKSTTTIFNRRRTLQHILLSAIPVALVTTTDAQEASAIPASEQKLYSSNARNMARMSSGDQSAGSVYDNDPSSPATAKRRAMLGCKINSSRKLAAKDLERGSFSEKDCNLKVMDGDSEFMLKALRKLECPTCPYGIDGA